MPSISDKRRTFRSLHEAGCFVIPNPWDVGSTRYLQHLGFKALATTSLGYAFSAGYADGEVPRGLMLDHIAELVEASDLPVNADFEGGYAHDPEGVAESVTMCVSTGVAGLSIEDATGDKDRPLYPFEQALARIKAARAAIDETGEDVMLTARTEGFIRGRPDMDETVKRLKAFAEAGADCLYAPGIKTKDEIRAVVGAVAPKPVNVLIGWPSIMSVQDVATLGVRRISVGGSLARAAWGGFMRAARQIAEGGSFGGFCDAAPAADLNAFFREDRKKRRPE
jgi:2-methylisocitrate lyase-like PEP mutase family enzyme